jgi:hypothetical protein
MGLNQKESFRENINVVVFDELELVEAMVET